MQYNMNCDSAKTVLIKFLILLPHSLKGLTGKILFDGCLFKTRLHPHRGSEQVKALMLYIVWLLNTKNGQYDPQTKWQ